VGVGAAPWCPPPTHTHTHGCRVRSAGLALAAHCVPFLLWVWSVFGFGMRTVQLDANARTSGGGGVELGPTWPCSAGPTTPLTISCSGRAPVHQSHPEPRTLPLRPPPQTPGSPQPPRRQAALAAGGPRAPPSRPWWRSPHRRLPQRGGRVQHTGLGRLGHGNSSKRFHRREGPGA
jgi:hypothetical protein